MGASARIAHYGLALEAGAAVRDRIYVSSRTSTLKSGMFANEEESIYGHWLGLCGKEVCN
jgi:hypothetical protein